MEIYYLEHIVKAVSTPEGWQIHVIDTNIEPMQVYTSSASYPTAAAAILSGKEFVQQQFALLSLWEFLDDCCTNGKISSAELDALSASLCFFLLLSRRILPLQSLASMNFAIDCLP